MSFTNKIGKKAALLSLMEIGLGGLLHSFKIPFSGHFLSLNQGFILSKSSLELKHKTAPASISSVAALLKSLSPAGKKLTPMLAISAQGLLFNLGIIIFGINPIGILLGMILLSLWAFIQPFLIYLLLYGKDLWFMLEYFTNKLSKILSFEIENLLVVLGCFVAIKVLLAIIVGLSAFLVKEKTFYVYQNFLSRYKKIPYVKETNPYLGALKDLCNPLFILSFIIFMTFLINSHSHNAILYWYLLRPIALGYLIFLFLRVFPIEKITQVLKNSKFSNLGKVLESSLEEIKK